MFTTNGAMYPYWDKYPDSMGTSHGCPSLSNIDFKHWFLVHMYHLKFSCWESYGEKYDCFVPQKRGKTWLFCLHFKHQMENAKYQEALSDTTKTYEEKIAGLVHQLEEEGIRFKDVEEQLTTAKRLVDDHKNSFQVKYAQSSSCIHLNDWVESWD